jgi:hypothetical protein
MEKKKENTSKKMEGFGSDSQPQQMLREPLVNEAHEAVRLEATAMDRAERKQNSYDGAVRLEAAAMATAPTPKFDPFTGQALAESSAIPKFDPATGEVLDPPKFDPISGAPMNRAAQIIRGQ